ncbi:DUF6164 family protein [Halomonas sp. Bachu 37]|uniref:DUF6164 family protein n=1 Tax=Halomonas kashgarensis TaxID=3084920 RepID=UPI0032177152
MAKLLFRLHNVTDEEAAEVRELLAEHGFDVYETQAGLFRLGVEAIWLRDASQAEQAQAVLECYQDERRVRLQAEYREAVARGDAPTLWRRVTAHPFQMLLVMVAVILIAVISLAPFLGF